jgi:hypothetical protein
MPNRTCAPRRCRRRSNRVLTDHADTDAVKLRATQDVPDRAGFTANQRQELAAGVTFTFRIDRDASAVPPDVLDWPTCRRLTSSISTCTCAGTPSSSSRSLISARQRASIQRDVEQPAL